MSKSIHLTLSDVMAARLEGLTKVIDVKSPQVTIVACLNIMFGLFDKQQKATVNDVRVNVQDIVDDILNTIIEDNIQEHSSDTTEQTVGDEIRDMFSEIEEQQEMKEIPEAGHKVVAKRDNSKKNKIEKESAEKHP